jgi:hypothetical protein
MSLDIDSDGMPCEARPRPRGRRRRLSANDEQRLREELLRISFARISEAQPARLRAIADNAQMAAALARYRGDQADAEAYEAIKRRAEGRLAWFRRQAAKA